MIEAYCDEAGIHKGAGVCVICGFFGGKGQWKRFDQDWRRALGVHNVPLDKFHALDFVGKNSKRHGFFYEWNDDRFNDLMGLLARAISRYKLYPVTAGVFISDFNVFSETQRRFFTGAEIRGGRLVSSGNPNRPYFVPFMKCVKRITSYAPVGGKADFFFGLDKSFSKYAKALYTTIKTSTTLEIAGREKLGQIAFPMAKETPALQAADLLTYLTVQHIEERRTYDHHPLPQGWLKALLVNTRMPDDHGLADRVHFETLLGKAHKVVGNWDGAMSLPQDFQIEQEETLPE